MANENLKRLLLKFSEATSIRKILDYIGTHIDFLDFDHNEGLQLNEEEFLQFMEAVTLCHKQDSRILPLVYKIYRKIRELVSYNDWFELFKNFFGQACGNSTIFYKLHRYDKNGYCTMRFADEACCDFLIEEFRLKKITFERMPGYRNLLSHSKMNFINTSMKP